MSEVDYGYGSDNEDYGYGDADEYGYEDNEEPVIVKAAVPAVDKRPKRRCSVTKFNLDDNEALTAADRIREMRNNDNNGPKSDCGFQTDNDMSSDDTDEPVETSTEKKKSEKKKKGALSLLRKRLSVAF